VLWWSAGLLVVMLVAVVAVALSGRTAAPRMVATAPAATSTVDAASGAPGPTAGAAVTAGATASTTPTRTPTTGPTATSAAAKPVRYRIDGDLCAAVDFAPAARFAAQPTSEPNADHSDKSDFTVYTCDRSYAQSGVDLATNASASIYRDAATASSRYADTKAHAPAGSQVEQVSGLGTNAFGYLSVKGKARTYQLYVVDGNLQLGVRLKITTSSPPTTEALRAAAVDIARATLPKIKV
jgi:hypothetical protein